MMVARNDDELASELLALMQQVAALSEAEAWEMKERLMKLVGEQKIRPASWVPDRKEQWDSVVKIEDEAGQVLAFVDRGGAQVLEPVDSTDDVFLSVEEEVALDFEAGEDELLNVGRAAWVVAHEAVDEHHLPVGELVSDRHAREVAEGKLGWQWADGVMEGLTEDKPAVVAGEGISIHEGVPVVVSGQWSWADEAAVSREEQEQVPDVVEGAWSAFGETGVTRGSTVPVGTVAEDGWDVAAEREREQGFHLLIDRQQGRESGVEWS